MKKFPFLRRPVRLILYAVLLALVSTAALIFAWQYKLDGIVLDHAIDTYAYLGTVVREDGQILDTAGDLDLMMEAPEVGGTAYLEAVPGELVQWLYDSEHVSRIDNRQTLAALVGEHTRVKAGVMKQTTKYADQMMSNVANQYWYLEGTVKMVTSDWEDDGICSETCQIRVDKMWSDPEYAADIMVVERTRLTSESAWEVGQRVFLLGEYIYSGGTGQVAQNTCSVYSAGAQKMLMSGYEGFELSLAQQNPYIILPDGVDAQQYIEDFLESTGLDAWLETQMRTKYTVTIRATQDMMMIPLFNKGKAKTYEGRVLTPLDMGKKVCVISSSLSYINNLSVGDTICLALSDGCYTTPSPAWNNGWESGNPSDGEELLEYGTYEEYEIVGIYSQIKRRIKNTLYFPFDNIFIPAEDASAAGTVRPYTFSFRVPGPDYVDFQAEIEPVLKEHGYALMLEDTGWDEVKETFYTMQSRRQLMLLCAAAAFAAAVLVFAVLLNAHCRYEYGLRRLMGATKAEAAGILGSTFAFTALPGAAVSVLAAWYMAVYPMRDALGADAVIPLPTDGQCGMTLALWAVLELAAIVVVLLALSLRGERRGLLRLIRR